MSATRQLLVCALAATGHDSLRPIAQDWSPPENLQRLRVIAAGASTSLGHDYRPEVAIDGSPGSKWVAAEEAGPTRPQWITLRFASPREVSAVGLFGEALGNDGLNAGAIQAASFGGQGFGTVLEIPEAPAHSWLASFPPVRTTALRVLITRSDGPTTHTDVHEIAAFGRPLPPEQVLAYLDRHLDAADQALASTRTTMATPECEAPGHRLGLAESLDALAARRDQARNNREAWEQLPESARAGLFDAFELLAIASVRLADTGAGAVRLCGGAVSPTPGSIRPSVLPHSQRLLATLRFSSQPDLRKPDEPRQRSVVQGVGVPKRRNRVGNPFRRSRELDAPRA